MNADKTLNDILVKLFNDLMEIEEKCLISGEFMNISGNDMHIIEAIGLDEPKRMSEVAAKMNVTTGTLTKAIEALEQKGYVNRCRNDRDKGWSVYHSPILESGHMSIMHVFTAI